MSNTRKTKSKQRFIKVQMPGLPMHDPEAMLVALHTALTLLEGIAGPGPEYELRRKALEPLEDDPEMEKERVVEAAAYWASGASGTWWALAQKDGVPMGIIALLGAFAYIFEEMAGHSDRALESRFGYLKGCDVNHGPAFVDEEAENAAARDALVPAFDSMWWDIYETTNAHAAIGGVV